MYPCVSHLANKYKLVYLLKIIHTPKAYIVELDSTPWMVNVMKQYAAAAAHHKILEETSKFRTLTLIGGGGIICFPVQAKMFCTITPKMSLEQLCKH